MTEGSLCLNNSGRKSGEETLLWYKEILRLDPSSRIFLPYARLLVETGRHTEAIDVLKAGLLRHAEYLEARLLLIDLLHTSRRKEEAQKEAEGIIAVLSQSSALWEIWSQHPSLRADQSAILLFLGASFCQKNHNIAEIIAAGIEALNSRSEQKRKSEEHGSDSPSSAAQELPQTPAHAESPLSSPHLREDTSSAASCFAMEEGMPWYGLDSVPDDDDIDDDESCAEQSQAKSPSARDLFFADAVPPLLNEDNEKSAIRPSPRSNLEGKSSLCTRSMALILEEQGATGEAADIYRELIEGSSSPEERAELNAKLNSLILGAENTPSAPSANSGILTMLESLATRLENKSHA